MICADICLGNEYTHTPQTIYSILLRGRDRHKWRETLPFPTSPALCLSWLFLLHSSVRWLSQKNDSRCIPSLRWFNNYGLKFKPFTSASQPLQHQPLTAAKAGELHNSVCSVPPSAFLQPPTLLQDSFAPAFLGKLISYLLIPRNPILLFPEKRGCSSAFP